MSRILGSCTLRGVVQSLERALPGRLGKMRPIDLSSVPDEARISKTTPPPGRLKASFVLETVLCLTRSRLIQSYTSLLGPAHPSEVGGKLEAQTNF